MHCHARSLAASSCAVVVLLASTCAPLGANATPLRRLVFDVDTRTHDSGEPIASSTRGTIGVEAIAATDDGGLVVDISEDAPPHRAPKVRVGITANGILIYDPGANVTDEETILLPFLARQVVPPDDLHVGATWSRPLAVKPARLTDDFRVAAIDGPIASIALTEREVVEGLNALDIVMQGNAAYDTVALVPREMHFERRVRAQTADATSTMLVDLDYRLTADSFSQP